VQVHPVALELKLVDLAFAVVHAVMLSVVPGLVWCWQAGAGRERDPSPRWPPAGIFAADLSWSFGALEVGVMADEAGERELVVGNLKVDRNNGDRSTEWTVAVHCCGRPVLACGTRQTSSRMIEPT
jgi:hypothetical protein